jgi:succinylglutamate desuccinylase
MLKNYLEKFKLLEKKHPGKITDSITFNFNKHKGHLVFCCLIHGNEVGALPAFLKIIPLIEKNELQFQGQVTFIIGNKPASLKNKRFIERDLNRCFHNSQELKTWESHRAQEIKSVVNDCDVFFDFHQTTRPCKTPFYIFAMHKNSYLWARAVGLSHIFVTRSSTKAFSPEGMCSDEYVRNLNKIGITLELGEQGLHKNAEDICFFAMKKSLYLMDEIYLRKKNLSALAKKNNDFTFLKICYSEKFDHPQKRLEEGFVNLQKISKNMLMGYSISEKAFFAPSDGYILFPQYPNRDSSLIATEELSPYIYVLASKIKKLT